MRRIVLLLGITLPVWAAEYHVATNGNDSAAGTLAAPWRTIQKAANTINPGDIAWIHGGVYTQRTVVSRSGTNNAPLTFAAWPSDAVILDGTWQNMTESQGMFEINKAKHIEVRGLRILNSKGAGIYANYATNLVVVGNFTSNSVSSGIGIWRSANVLVASNEIVLACNDGYQECLTVAITDGFDVRDNVIRDGGPGTRGGEGIDLKDGAHNGRAYRNHIYRINRVGMYVDAWNKLTTNITVEANIIHHCRSGISVANENSGLLADVRVINNLCYSNRYGGFVGGWGEPGATHYIRDVVFAHNTFADNWGSTWGGGLQVENSQVTNIVIRNNIFSQNQSFQIAITPDVPRSQVIVDNNLIDGFRGYDSSEVRGSNYVEGAAQFLNRSAADYRLAYNSPAIDRAAAMPGITNDLTGGLRPVDGNADGQAISDLGAFEYDPVRTDSDRDGLSDAWERQYFGNPIAGIATGDEDGDGLINVLEFALAGNPLVADAALLLPAVGLMIPSSARYLALTYRQSKAATDLVFEPQAAGALTNGAWSSAGVVEIGREDAGPWWNVTARDSVPVDAAQQRFMRLKVSGP